MRGQGAGRPKGRRHAFVVVGGHLLRQIGHIEELRKHIVHVAILLRRALDKDTRGALRIAKGDRLLRLDRSATNKKGLERDMERVNPKVHPLHVPIGLVARNHHGHFGQVLPAGAATT